MIDTYLQSLDEKINELKEDLWESNCSNKMIVFDLLEAMNCKMTYIAKNPERAKAHYSENKDIGMIKELRRRLGFNQQQFADFIGVTRESISHWETGRRPITDIRRTQFKELLKQYESPNASLFMSFDTLTTYEKIHQELSKDK